MKKPRSRTQAEVDLIKAVNPIEKVVIYKTGHMMTIRKSKLKQSPFGNTRGQIKTMTRNSIIRLMFTMQITEVQFGTMLTLTYPRYFPIDGRIVKADINYMAAKARRLNWNYLWFLEFQRRGAPHVHFLFDVNEISPSMRTEFGLGWTTRIATSDWFLQQCPQEEYRVQVLRMAKVNMHESVFEIIRDPDGAKKYVTKYAAKQAQKRVPKTYQDVGRFWGCSTNVIPDGLVVDVSEDDLERWLVEHGHPARRWDLVPKYIWTYANGTEDRGEAQAQVL